MLPPAWNVDQYLFEVASEKYKLGLSWAKLSPSWDLTVSKIYYIEFLNKIKWLV